MWTTHLLCASLWVAQPPAQDPTQGEVLLPAAAGWNASLVHESDAGIWYLLCGKIVPQYGCPEIVGCDDKGRFTLLTSYSGKWTPYSHDLDHQWVAPAGPADVDPRVPGPELYAGGRAGNLHRIRALLQGTTGIEWDTTEIAHFPGEEVHVVLAADLRPPAGDELLVFTMLGNVYEVRPGRAGPPDAFTTRRLAELGGRVRDAVVLPAPPGQAPWFATVSRSGELALLRLGDDRLERQTLAREPMGLGRVARRPPRAGAGEVLYVTRDDGLILRFEGAVGGAWQREPVYAGPQGPRGLVAGRFCEERDCESIAVFGYSRKVQLLSRLPGQPWRAETIYTDADQGHWLAVGEVDGRNGTDEILGSTFGGRIVLVSRPPGYGLCGVTVEPPTAPTSRPTHEVEPAAPRGSPRGSPRLPRRVAVVAGETSITR